MNNKSSCEIQNHRAVLENEYERIRNLVRERLKITLELATNAEERWNSSTPPDRVVLLKNILSNFSLDGATVRYNLKSIFRVVAQFKNRLLNLKC